MTNPYDALASLGATIALTSFRNARIEQGQQKIAAGVAKLPKPGVGVPLTRSATNPVKTLEIASTASNGKKMKVASADELGSALAACLREKEI